MNNELLETAVAEIMANYREVELSSKMSATLLGSSRNNVKGAHDMAVRVLKERSHDPDASSRLETHRGLFAFMFRQLGVTEATVKALVEDVFSDAQK